MISNGTTFAGGFEIGRELGVRDVRLSNWVAASYPLTQGTFVLVSGRLGSVYGHKKMLLVGGAWFSLWSFLNIACRSFLSFNIARGFTGMGGALILPNAVAMIGITFPPGRSRNFCMGIFGAAAPIGGYLGAVLPVDAHGKIDWIGAALGTARLIMFNFTWNQAPAAGWKSPYQIGILIGSVLTLAAFAVWELYCPEPIMPLSVWKAPSFLPLMLSVLKTFMSFGKIFWYMLAWIQLIRNYSVLHCAAVWVSSPRVGGMVGGWDLSQNTKPNKTTPFLTFGVFAARLASHLIPLIPVQYILAIGLLSVASYWAQVFPATILMSFCPDLVFTAAQIVASNAVSRAQQGVASSLVGVLLLYGNSVGLGFAGMVEMQVGKGGEGVGERLRGYRSALWFGCAIALVALVLDPVSVRMEKDEREGWVDEGDCEEEDRAVASGVELLA
ncbi:MFS general substrate transporter [Lophium mytilinum]|uniref:MFS general substrate transporter n=1 Tax=Lophium mytilinum TaxID=390894 RepID=A0A6A6QSI3_9PEZI|nr:MFS general substrate transporter [Lophium mytilinum]